MHARRAVLCATSVPFLGGCLLLGDHDGGREQPGPELVAMSRDEIRVGQRLELLGERIDYVVGVRFEGEFRGDDGSIHRVDLTLQPELVEDRLVIPYFGPYQVPFGDGDEIGTFTGTVTALEPGEEAGVPLDVELRVLPSIIVRELASADVSCDSPSRILLGGGRLYLEAEAIGFDAADIAVRLGDGAEVSSPDGQIELDIPAVPDGKVFAVSELLLTARDGNDVVVSDYLIGVHRSLEYVAAASPQVAEIEEAVPVSGCFSGGDTQGRTLTYSEQAVDVRERIVEFTWNESYTENGEPADALSLTEVGLRQEVDGPRPGAKTDTWTVGREQAGPGLEPGNDSFWKISSIDALGEQEGMILPGEYGVWYRQTTRMLFQGAMVEFDACGSPDVVAGATGSDYRWEVDLAQGDECPPFPEPDLPPAECLIAPCQ